MMCLALGAKCGVFGASGEVDACAAGARAHAHSQLSPRRGGRLLGNFSVGEELAAKYNSKTEIYNFLACDMGVYLPHSDHVTIWFLKDLMNGTKKMIRNTHVRTCHVPQ